MILLAGLPDEPPIALVAEALDDIGAPFVMLDQRRHRDIGLRLIPAGAGGEVGGTLSLPDHEPIDLATIRGVYTRLHSDESFPDIANLATTDSVRQRFQRIATLITTFADLCSGVVYNRSHGMSTNNSKGLQAQIIAACGFQIPRTLITNDPAAAQSFIDGLWAEGNEVVYKSASAIRSIVRTVEQADIDRLRQIRICPVQFQQRVHGVDHRVHVVGEEVFATRIETTGTDYRYAARERDGASDLSSVELPPEIARRCVRLAQDIGIAFAGIDLRRTPDGGWVCFEVNPSPAFSFYEAHTGQPIANAVARHLAGALMQGGA